MIETSKHHLSKEALANEQVLIAEAKKNAEKFAPLYNTYFEKLFRFIYQRLDDKEQAFDSTQQVFLKAMNNIHRYENRGVPFCSWLYRIALNEITNLVRSQKVHRTVNIDSVCIYAIIEDIEETKIEKYHDKIVAIISKNLKEKELRLIEMRYFEKRSFNEIGEILDITENNAKVKTYRVLAKLKKIIKV